MFVFFTVYLTSAGPQCIDADDFGFPKAVVQAKPDDIRGTEYNQFVPWTPTGLITNGQQIVLTVSNSDSSVWSSWGLPPIYLPDQNYADGIVSKEDTSRIYCEWWAGNGKTSKCNMSVADPKKGEKFGHIVNKPCWFRNGQGLYAAFMPGTHNPNIDEEEMQYPERALAFRHLGDCYSPSCNPDTEDCYGHVSNNLPAGGVVIDSMPEDASLYLKIVDNHYDNNIGQYNSHYQIRSKRSLKRNNF